MRLGSRITSLEARVARVETIGNREMIVIHVVEHDEDNDNKPYNSPGNNGSRSASGDAGDVTGSKRTEKTTLSSDCESCARPRSAAARFWSLMACPKSAASSTRRPPVPLANSGSDPSAVRRVRWTGMNTGSGMSGSTDWHNAVRSRLYLKTLRTQESHRGQRLAYARRYEEQLRCQGSQYRFAMVKTGFSCCCTLENFFSLLLPHLH
jgi:hypothetical protein